MASRVYVEARRALPPPTLADWLAACTRKPSSETSPLWTSAGRSSTHRATLLPVWHHNSNFRTGAAFLGIGREYFDFREEAFSQQPKLSAHLTLARYEKIHANPLLKGLRVLQDPGRVTLSFDRICIFEGEHSVLWLASRIETM